MTEQQELTDKYSRITEENIHRRGHEFDDIGDHLAKELYSERTHFIYELLQNAEDALARRLTLAPDNALPRHVTFSLFSDRLEVRHFGQPFNDKDVGSISDVFRSTKTTDLNMIGKKGIGFKSVYAFTDTPEVFSGRERFQIYRYIRLKLVERRDLAPEETLFVLPFAGDEKARESAFSHIQRGLEHLERRALLFLRHITEVSWSVGGIPSGSHSRVQSDTDITPRLKLRSRIAGSDEHEDWLVFRRPVKEASHSVEVAFRLVCSDQQSPLKIAPVPNARLRVYFPTKRETHLGFLIQGPFRTIANREDVHEPVEDDSNDWNRYLATEAGELVVEALRWLRDRDVLDAEALSTLPLKRADFADASLLRPVFDRVLKAIKEEPLLTAHAQTPDAPRFITGSQAKVATSVELRELLSPEQLRQLAGAEAEWCWLGEDISVHGDSDLAYYLRKEVGVGGVTASDFVSWLEKQDANWWKGLEDGWLIRAYRYLQLEAAALNTRLRKLPMIRLESGEHVSTSVQAVFFPADNIQEKEELAPFLLQLPIVRQSVLNDDEDKVVENFLRQMGAARLAVTEFIRLVLIPRYSSPKGITVEENRTHVRFVFQAFQRMPRQEKRELVSKLCGLNWLLGQNLNKAEKLFFVSPAQTYLPRTYTGKSSLEKFFSATPETWFLDSGYPREGEEWLGFLADMGCARHPRRIEDGHGLEGLTSVITRLPTLANDDRVLKAAAIFDVLSEMVPEQGYSRHTWVSVESRVWVTRRGPGGGDWCHRQEEARFFSRLKRTVWMPDVKGELHCPDELFEHNDHNGRLLGDGVAYLHKDIALDSEERQWLATELGVHRRATKESVLGRLRGMKVQTASLKQVVPLYEFLAQTNAEVAGDFQKGELILCPDADPVWRAPSQVFWDDESPVFGTTRGYLKKHYPALREFLAGTGVAQSAGPTDYVQALLELAKTGLPDRSTQTRIHRIYKRLVPRLEEDGDWQREVSWQTCWAQLRAGRTWLARKGGSFDFFEMNDLVRVDNDHLAELFRDSLSFWPFPDLNSFASEQLKLTPVSSAQCRFKVESEQQVLQQLADGLRANWTIIAAFLRSEKWFAAVREGARPAVLTAPTVRLAQRIAVTYELKGATAEEPDGKDGFVDAEQAVIWLTQKQDEDDLVESLGDALQEFFGPEVLREFVCDLFRKGPTKAVEKWRKKGLILSQPATEEHPDEESKHQVPAVKEGESSAAAGIPEATNLVANQEQSQSTSPGQSVALESTPAEHPVADPSAAVPNGSTAVSPSSAEVKPLPVAPVGGLQTQRSEQKDVHSDLAASTQDTRGSLAPHTNEERTQEKHPSASGPTNATRDIKQALEDAFNKPGKTGISEERPESGPVGNAKERRKRTRDNYSARKAQEPLTAQRITRHVIDIWDPKNKAIRDFLYEEYGGRCQICSETNRFPRRDGKAYFEAVYLIPHTQAAWTDEPGSVICLCALCSAKFQHGAVECRNVSDQIRDQKTAIEGAQNKPAVSIRLVGKSVTINFSERHLIEVQELLSIAD